MRPTLEALSKSSELSVAALDEHYEAILNENIGNPEAANVQIRALRDLCLRKSVDFTGYVLRAEKVSEKRVKKPLAVTSPLSEPVSAQSPEVSIEQVIQIYERCFSFLSFYMFRVPGNTSGSTQRLLVLHGRMVDERTILSQFTGEEVQSLEKFSVGSLDRKFTWVVFVLFHSSSDLCIQKNAEILLGYSDSKVFSWEDFINQEENFWKKDRGNVFNGTFHENPCPPVDADLNAQIGFILKNYFGRDAGFLIYSKLTGGRSGSVVLLVSQVGGLGDNRKYVVKISPKGDQKLKSEYDRFKSCVEPIKYGTQQITADWCVTEKFQAIRYPFASADTISHSESFSKVFSDRDNPQDFRELIPNIFNHRLLQGWRERPRVKRKRKKFIDAFSGIVDRKKTFEALAKLAPLSRGVEVDIARIDSILEREIEYVSAFAHGDFHSDNIQVQSESKEAFLIDFGLTGEFPAGVDYAALESSIRFKLTDFAIDEKSLEIDDFPNYQNFDSLISLETAFANPVEKMVKCSSLIREKFLNDFSGFGTSAELRRQYMFCLFAFLLRQVAYPDLNRRYILSGLLHFLKTVEPSL